MTASLCEAPTLPEPKAPKLASTESEEDSSEDELDLSATLDRFLESARLVENELLVLKMFIKDQSREGLVTKESPEEAEKRATYVERTVKNLYQSAKELCQDIESARDESDKASLRSKTSK